MDCKQYFNIITKKICTSEQYFKDNNTICKKLKIIKHHSRIVLDKELEPMIQQYRAKCDLKNFVEFKNPGISVTYEGNYFYYFYNKHYKSNI